MPKVTDSPAEWHAWRTKTGKYADNVGFSEPVCFENVPQASRKPAPNNVYRALRADEAESLAKGHTPLASQQDMNALVSISNASLGDIPDPHPERCIITGAGSVSAARSIQQQKAARTSL